MSQWIIHVTCSVPAYTPPSGSNAFEADVIGGHPLPCLGRAVLKAWAFTTDWCSSRWAIVCRRSVCGFLMYSDVSGGVVPDLLRVLYGG